MATTRKNRDQMRKTQTPSDLTESVMVRIEKVSPKALPATKSAEDEEIYYAKAIPQKALLMADLLARMDRERARVSPHVAKMVLEVALETIVTMMREGKQITLDDYFTFGVSVKGRVKDPDNPKANTLQLRPWVRCNPKVADRINQEAHIAVIGRTRGTQEDAFSGLRRARIPQKRTAATDEDA